MKNLPNLKRIIAPYPIKNDAELGQLMQAKKQQNWMTNWNDPVATKQDRYQILQQVLSGNKVEEQDQVAALYHVVRSNPGLLPLPSQQQQLLEDQDTSIRKEPSEESDDGDDDDGDDDDDDDDDDNTSSGGKRKKVRLE